MTGISSALTSSLSSRENLFSRIDANADGKVTKDEFVTARPKDVSESQASALFAKLDTDGAGSLTQSQLEDGLQANKPSSASSDSLTSTLASEVLAAILQLAQEVSDQTATVSDSASSSGVASATSKPSASELFSKIDTNADGSVSKDEFVANRPDDVSEDQASAFFDRIDTQGSGSISESQFETALQNGPDGQSNVASAGGAGGPPPGGPPPASDSDDTQTYDALDTNEDGEVSIQELAAGLEKAAQEAQATSTDGNTDALLAQLLKAAQSYTSTSANNNAASTVSVAA